MLPAAACCNPAAMHSAHAATPAARAASPSAVPPFGFAVQLLGHLTPVHRQAIAQQRELYQWAFDQARREYDQKLFWDWSI
jgi:hypothetical protein